MGLFWKKCTIESNVPPEGYFWSFPGDPVAIGKTIPLLWRRSQNWHGLDFGCSEFNVYGAGYYLYFKSGDNTMVCRRVLNERHVMVRVGPQPITFWARDIRTQAPLATRQLDTVIPSVFAALMGADISQAYQRVERLSDGVAWV